MTQNIKTDRETKRKVWMVFLISFLITCCICYVSYESFLALTGAINRLSQPDERVELINETFQEIVEAENNIQSYILSNDGRLEREYLIHARTAKLKIAELKTLLNDDSLQLERVDSLEILYETKLSNLETFLELKNKRQQEMFTGQALNKIQNQMNDTAVTERQLLRREFLNAEFTPKEKVLVVEDESKGVKGFFRKMLGSEETYVDTVRTVKDEFSLSKQVRVDTTVIKSLSYDTTLLEVKNILSQALKEEKRMQRRMSAKELELLKQDMRFISNIRGIIYALKQQEKAESAIANHAATRVVAKSTLFIISVGLVGLLMSGGFLFLILRDITGSFYYRIQLEKEKARAEKLALAKEEFLSNMSHEIRTPLQSIKGFSELIGQTTLDPRQSQFLTAIKYSNEYLSGLINDVLDQAKIEAGMLELSKQPFDLPRIVHEIQTVYGKTSDDKGVVFKVNISSEIEDIELVGDAMRIKQVLINLVSNAIKFTTEGFILLDIQGTKKDDTMELVIQVQDTGIGISTEMQTIIFDQFTQEINTTTQNYRGTGLGLSIAKSLTEAMEGKISLESELGKGSTFKMELELPYIEKQKNNTIDLPLVSLQTKFAVQVLVVEDDDWNATLIKEVLSQLVNEVKVFQQAHLALEFLLESESQVNLILTDIKMAGMDGAQFLTQVRAAGIQTPMIALTAHVQPDKLQALKDEGFDQVYSKPYNTSDIQQILAQYFEPVRSDSDESRLETSDEKVSSENQSIFDFSLIYKYAGGNEDTFKSLLSSLLSNNERQLNDYQNYLETDNMSQMADLCHQMKTSYDNLGLTTISEALASIELFHQIGKLDRAKASAEELSAELHVVFEKLRDQLKRQFDI
ncbi:ATP-binding protein [Reichenbachiella agarivorans]|uniref:histidine kinase n=1 Tax=Reichenbachiella agarivorans TaxID=2979464 RepID=A0ABY6CS78_9BACT|nr:ATP-binding protein [Reichenbachiella agarivorans]UXP33362.1 ATP-binding protein [Reichenbachiella agarivorans]